jgi:Flp pilus assembly protein TadG
LQHVSVLRRLVALGPDRRATVSVELALTLPLLITLLGGGLEITNYVLIYQKVERTSATISDLVAQSARMTESEMKSLFSATEYVMKPFDLATDGNVVVSSISASGGNPPVISWQRSSGGGHNGSRFGVEGAAAILPAGLSVRDGDNIIACEAYYHYQPMLFRGVVEETTLYRYAFFRPRFGKLDVIYP